MAIRISGIILPNNKRVEIALTSIFGIGRNKSNVLLKEAKIDRNIKTQDLSDAQIAQLRRLIEEAGQIEGDLRRDILQNIRRLKEIKSYRGTRHSRNLPARGQRSKTNSRTVRGNVRRTMGSGRRPAAKKT